MPDPSIFTSVINSYLPEPHASLLNGMIFGIPLKGSKVLNKQLIEVGLIHMVVLSGSNISIITAIGNNVTRSFSKHMQLLISILFVCLFVRFVGIQAPILRAAFMSILTSVSIIYGRKTISLYILFLSGFLSLLLYPKWLCTISFQLSYAATLGLILFGRYTHSISTANTTFWTELILIIKKEFKISLAAQVFTVPIIFLYFKQISFIAPLSNILVAWTVAPIMVFGLTTAMLGKINYSLGLLPSYICFSLLQYILIIVRILVKIPFIFYSM